MQSKLSLLAFLALTTLAATGCSSGAVRYLTATRSTPSPSGQRVYYLTYYEGNCSSGFLGFRKGCTSGNSHVRRCNLGADNSVTCVDEADATRALAKE